MSAGNAVQVACLGFVFDAAAQRLVQAVAPANFALSFAETPDETTAALVERSDFLLCVSHVTEAMIGGAPRLRLIHKWGIGVDKIDLAAAERHGVYVAITAGANATVIAEHAVLLMLAVLRRVAVADRSVRDGRWAPAELRPKSRQIRGKTVGIVGFGNIGRAVAGLLAGFGVDLVFTDPRGAAAGAGLPARFLPLPQLLAESDIVTLHCPGGGANRHLLDRAAIAAMKPGAVIVNAARGELIDEAALADALVSGHLLGAGLDTFETEPLDPQSRLRGLDSVVLTPHSAGSILDGVEKMAAHAFANMQRMLDGDPIPAADLVVVPAHPRFAAASAGTAP